MHGRIQAEAKERLSEFASLVKLIAKKRITTYNLTKISQEGLHIVVSDLVSFLTLRAELEGFALVGEEQFKTDINKFLQFLEEEGAIEFSLNSRFELKAGKKKIKLPVEEVEELKLSLGDPIKAFSIHPSFLQKGVEKVIDFSNPKDLVFSHILIKADESGFEIVGTDGHRLAIYTIPETEQIGQFSLHIPHEAVKVLQKWFDIEVNFVEVEVHNEFVKFKGEHSELLIRLGEVNFPDYRAVIPKEWKYEIPINKQELLSIMQDVKDYLGVVPTALDIDKGCIKVEASDPDEGEYENELEVAYNGDRLRVGFNVSYLIDALELIDDDRVVMLLNDEESVVGIKPENPEEKTEAYVMPMRL